MKKILLLLLFAISLGVNAQTFFFVDKEVDSTSNDFYEYHKKFSVLYQINLPNNFYGVTLVLHNEEQRLSYYLEAKTNWQNTEIITGQEIDNTNNEIQKRVTFSEFKIGSGLAIPVLKNFLVYGNVGIRYIKTYRDYTPDRGYNFAYRNEADLHVAAGVIYVSDKGLSLQCGLDIITKTLDFGIGFTL